MERGERSERPPRRSESERGERPPRTYGAGPLPRREKVDPWFLKPYEPAAPAAAAEPESRSQQGSKPQKAKVAALLGGLPKR